MYVILVEETDSLITLTIIICLIIYLTYDNCFILHGNNTPTYCKKAYIFFTHMHQETPMYVALPLLVPSNRLSTAGKQGPGIECSVPFLYP